MSSTAALLHTNNNLIRRVIYTFGQIWWPKLQHSALNLLLAIPATITFCNSDEFKWLSVGCSDISAGPISALSSAVMVMGSTVSFGGQSYYIEPPISGPDPGPH